MAPDTKIQVINPSEMNLNRGPESNFSGKVHFSMLVAGEDPSTMTAAYVCFECSARSAWHSHPKGQLVVVTEGSGLIQEWGKPVRKIHKGDVIGRRSM